MAPLPNIFEQEKLSHQLFHQNAPGLVRQFHLIQEQAQAIVAACPSCTQHALPTLSAGVNPRGFKSCEVWQTDVTHFPEFGHAKYIHISVDTFSGVVFASAHTGEKSMDAINHLVQAFSFMGIPRELRTDNSLAYHSREFCSFLQQWGVEHKTDIPHSPTGQAVVERTHQDIKTVLHQQQKVLKTEPPSIWLARALFTINFLNCSFEGLNPPVVRHFGASHQFNIKEKPPVMVRNPETGKAEGPHELVTRGWGYACVSTPMGPKWLPSKWFMFTCPKGQERFFQFVYQTKGAYTARTWCDQVAHVQMATTHDADPLALPKGVFLICGDRAWAGIPPRLIGGPCTFGRLGLFSPNKTTLMDWQRKNSTQLAVKKRDLSAFDANCDSEIIHWSKSKGVAITVFLPWVSIAKALGEWAHLECWVAKQENLTSNTLASLLSDEEVTRQATLQNRTVIDYLLLLHRHRCKEFEGLCCFNLSSKAENIYDAIQKIRDMVGSIKKETNDWLDGLFSNWGISDWAGLILKTVLLILFILILVLISFGIIKRMLFKLISSTTHSPTVNQVMVPSAPQMEEGMELEEDSEENGDPEEEEEHQEEWVTQQQWFTELYLDSIFLPHSSSPPLKKQKGGDVVVQELFY
ncbi:hypothetical protein DUI87_07822 [Hirundo rustica rustica]|uniref:RNA-directed DNA polymerase n=1 Tax=Hirundo rustica rustica TaxID=333673 RepID=A0A3M0KXZ2_HIRRU|nr:hypothetical protein DUI87_07822 [Hirundo rustica rustica]